MSAFLIAKVTVKDGVKFQQYAEGSAETFPEFGGEVFIKGVFTSSFSGDEAHNAAVIKFPNLTQLNSWY